LSDNDFSGSPQTDTDIISAQHFWTGGLETAGLGCYDAVAIARAAGFRMLVMSRIRHAAIVPYPLHRLTATAPHLDSTNGGGGAWRHRQPCPSKPTTSPRPINHPFSAMSGHAE
jgi:hypothetical protein